MASGTARWLVAAVVCAGCQHDVLTVFPAGLEPLADDARAGAIEAPVAEAIVTDDDTSDIVRVYGRAYIHAPVADVFAAAMMPPTLVSVCQTDAQAFTPDDEPGYALAFVVHYTVHEGLTVEWDDQYRGDHITGDADGDRVMIRHQKIEGSSFITTSEGTVQLFTGTGDAAGFTELQMVEHLDATAGSVDPVRAGMVHQLASLLAITHGGAAPACP